MVYDVGVVLFGRRSCLYCGTDVKMVETILNCRHWSELWLEVETK